VRGAMKRWVTISVFIYTICKNFLFHCYRTGGRRARGRGGGGG
jgi:hypothetical protein